MLLKSQLSDGIKIERLFMKKECIGKFKFPDCLTKDCRHDCVQKFNAGKFGERKILLNLESREGSIKKSEIKVVHKAGSVKLYDRKTLDEFGDMFSGTSFERSERVSEGSVKWLYQGRITIWVKKAINGKVLLRVPKDFPHKEVQVVKVQHSLTVLLTKLNKKKFQTALYAWLSNQK